jgi:hypothetical protein
MKHVAGTIKDPTIKFSTLTIDEQDYKLAYSFNSIAEAEAVTKTNLLNGLETLTNLNASNLRGLLWAAMLIAQPKTTLEDAGTLIRLDTIGPVTLALAEAYNLSLPEKKSVDEPPKQNENVS